VEAFRGLLGLGVADGRGSGCRAGVAARRRRERAPCGGDDGRAGSRGSGVRQGGGGGVGGSRARCGERRRR
jgi:hypothetical protein